MATDSPTPNSNASTNTEIGNPNKKFRLPLISGELNRTSFWISQIFMLIATVLGVYLAAQEGLRQAVAYEYLMSTKSNYYLRQSLADEIQSNIQQVRDWADYAPTVSNNTLKSNPLTLDTFIWDSMKYAPNTLETPSQFLSSTRHFYRESLRISTQLQSFNYSINHGRDLLKKLADNMEQELLPKMHSDIAALKHQLAEHDVPLD